MIYDFKKESDIKKARYVLEKHISSQSKCEVNKVSRKRTLSQNNALHLLFKNIADQLNEIGETFVYRGFKGHEMEMPFTMELIKSTLWKPIQVSLFNIESTTHINTHQINTILDVITKFFGERNIPIVFPSQFELLLQQELKRNEH